MIEEKQIDSYLSSLRLHLGPLTLNDREEIVREIGAHVRDSVEESGASIETVLARLGPPQTLAAQYRDGLLIRQASRSISPLVLLRGALRLATKGVFGVFVFFVGILGYGVGGCFVLTALGKCLFPEHTGTWILNGDVVASGTQSYIPQAPAHEVFGMWYIPLALVLGSLTLMATTIIIRTSLRLSQRWQAKL